MSASISPLKLISPTARLIAFLRSFSNIPNARQISQDVDGEIVARRLYKDDFSLLTRFAAPTMEARYKCFDHYLDKYRNILEIGVGLSIERGHRVTSDHKVSYIGTDLPGVAKESRSLLSTYYSPHINHKILDANVLSDKDMSRATRRFGSGEILVINEGLWMYLSREEQLVGATNIRRILERNGGVWITPDFDDEEYLRSSLNTLPADLAEKVHGSILSFSQLTRRNLMGFMPKTEGELHKFFSGAGLTASPVPMMHNDIKLSSIRALWGDERYPYWSFLSRMRLWIIRP